MMIGNICLQVTFTYAHIHLPLLLNTNEHFNITQMHKIVRVRVTMYSPVNAIIAICKQTSFGVFITDTPQKRI